MNARLVRGTWLLVALPLLLAAFSVARPQPLPPPTLPPTFDVAIAEQLTRDLAAKYPDRSPGSPGSLGAAAWIADQFELYGFDPRVDQFTAKIPGRGEVELRNVVTVVRGASQRTIVITAHRDNIGEGPGVNHNASGTGALIELARAFASVGGATLVQAKPTYTLVFVSTDGGAFGALGAAHFAESSPYRENALAVISLDALAGSEPSRLVIAGDTARSPSASLVRTAALRVLEQTGTEPVRDSAVRQLLDLGFPFTLHEQGPFVARGIPALTLTTLPDSAAEGFATTAHDDTFDVQTLAELGRASQNLIGSLDAGLELAQGTTSYVYFGTRIVRGWAIELVLMTALLPFLIGTIDLFAHCRRRRIPLAPAARSLRRRLYFWGYAAALVFAASLLGAFPQGEPRPLPPDPSLYEPSPAVLGILGVLLLVGWLVARERLLPRRPTRPEETLAGHTVALRRTRSDRTARRRDEPVLARLPAALALRLALAAAGAGVRAARPRGPAGARLHRPADPPALLLDAARARDRDAVVPALARLRRVRPVDRRRARLRLARRRGAADGSGRRPVRPVFGAPDPAKRATAPVARRPCTARRAQRVGRLRRSAPYRSGR